MSHSQDSWDKISAAEVLHRARADPRNKFLNKVGIKPPSQTTPTAQYPGRAALYQQKLQQQRKAYLNKLGISHALHHNAAAPAPSKPAPVIEPMVPDEPEEEPEEEDLSFKEKIKAFFTPKEMTAKEILTLDWWTKWRKFGRPPSKLFLHIAICVLSSILIAFQTDQSLIYVVNNQATMYKIFYPDAFNMDYSFNVVDNRAYYFYIQDVVDTVNKSVRSFYATPSSSVDMYGFDVNSTSPKSASPKLVVTSFQQNASYVFDPHQITVDTSSVDLVYQLSPDNLGPLDQPYPQLQEFFHSLIKMELHFRIFNVHIHKGHPIDHEWLIKLKFDFSSRGGRIVLDLECDKELIAVPVPIMEILSFNQIIVEILLVVFCIVSAIVGIRSLSVSFDLYQQIKKKSTNVIAWKDLPLSVKIKFINAWFIISIVSNVVLILACIFDVIANMGPEAIITQVVNVLLGVGCLLSWLNLLRYISFDKKWRFYIQSLGGVLPNVIKSLISFAFLYMGFGLFAMLNFSQDTARFEDLGEAFVTLWSLSNGDDIQATFRSVSSWTGRVFFYSWIVVSIYGVTNIFISTIKEAYFAMKNQNKNDTKEYELNDSDQLWADLLEIHQVEEISVAEKEKMEAASAQIKELVRVKQQKFNQDLEQKILNLVAQYFPPDSD